MRAEAVFLFLVFSVWEAVALAGTEDTKAIAAEMQPSSSAIEVRCTFGPGGSTRPAEIIAGEILYLTMIASNIPLTSTGKVDYRLHGEMLDATGKVVQPIPDLPVSGQPWLGETSFFQHLPLAIPWDSAPGTYQVHFVLYGAQGMKCDEKTLPIVVRPHDAFGATNFRLFHDLESKCPATGVFAAGTEMTVVFQIVGCDTSQGRFRVKIKATALAEDGKVVSAQPIETTMDKPLRRPSDYALVSAGIPAHFQLWLSRPGKFKIRIEIEDPSANLSAIYDVPIVVEMAP